MNKPMNVVLINHFSTDDLSSGSPIIFEGFARYLSQNENIKLNIISVGEKTAVYNRENYNVCQIKKNRLYYIPFITPLLYFKVKRIVNRINPHVIHVGCTGYWYFFMALLLQKKYPLVTTVLGILAKELSYRKNEYNKNWFIVKYKILFEKFSFARLKHLIVPSRHIIPYVKEIGGTKAQYFAIPDGIDYDKIQHIKPIADLNGDILFLSKLDKLKGVDVLIKAVALLVNEIPTIKVIIGGAGPGEQRFKALVGSLKLENHIIFKGVIKGENNKYGVVKACKVLVAPSRWDCQPYAVIEGAACGKATIASDASNPEFLDDGKTGLVFESENHVDFADKLKQLLLNDDLRKEMGDAGLIKSRKCDWTVVVDQSIEIYSKVIDQFNINKLKGNS